MTTTKLSCSKSACTASTYTGISEDRCDELVACRKKKEEAAALKALKEKASAKGGFAKVKGSK